MTEELERNPLWLILVETARALPMYASHKAYVRDALMLEDPDIRAEEISLRLDIPLGEALVILHDIEREKQRGRASAANPQGSSGSPA
ncbi:MAG: hypothetical protein ACE5OO_06550 [Candidatus Bathyarchaeia archaeon]